MSTLLRLHETWKEILKIQKFRRVVSYAGVFGISAFISYVYTNNTTRVGYSRGDQLYAAYPVGTELLTDTAKLYKVALGNCFEEDEWGPIEWGVLVKHFERQGKSPYAYHAMTQRTVAKVLISTILCTLLQITPVVGIRFLIDHEEECFSHNVQYEGDTVHVSFVVIKAETTWTYSDDGVDLVIKGPSGEQIHSFHDKTSEKYEFMAQRKGLYRFCFKNKSTFHETIDFDLHVGHYFSYNQHAKDEHFNPLLEQISKLEEALFNIQFEQHWLEAQTDRQAVVNDAMSNRAVYKAIFESLLLVGASFLQLYVFQQLFERKLRTTRV